MSDSTATPIEVHLVLEMLTFRKIFCSLKSYHDLINCVKLWTSASEITENFLKNKNVSGGAGVQI